MNSSNTQLLKDTVWADGSRQTLRCIVCDDGAEKSHVISTPHVFPKNGKIDFYRCGACGSLCAQAPVFTDYDGKDYDNKEEAPAEIPAWMQDYFQLGAGIECMIAPVVSSGAMKDKTFLDVGCGFGFTLDYWNWSNGGGAYGCDPSAYGRLGKSVLGINISPCYLADDPALMAMQFDRILSSEVIEHVDDPLAFIKELHARLTGTGILILTTPNGDYIEEKNPLNTLLAALSPGLHRVLFSRKAMTMLLQKAGFKHVDVKATNERLVAYASDQPLHLTENRKKMHHSYISYLQDRSQKDYLPDLKLGFLFRLFKECVNDGSYEKLPGMVKEIQALVEQKYGIDIYDLKRLSEISAGVTGFDDYGKKFPFFISIMLYYIAMAQRQGWIEGDNPEEFFSTAARLILDACTLSPNNFQEPASLYWPAVFETGMALLAKQKREEAISYFDKVLEAKKASGMERVLQLRDEVRMRALKGKGMAMLQQGEPEAAMGHFRKLIHQSDGKMRKEALNSYKMARSQARQEVAPFFKSTTRLLANPMELYARSRLSFIKWYGDRPGSK